MKYFFFLFILWVFVSPGVSAQIPAQTIPEFQFFRADKKPFTNKDLPGGKMLFFVFFDPGCDHCQHAMKNMDKNYLAFKKTATYLLSLDNHNKMNDFMDKYGPHLKKQKNVRLLQDQLNQFVPKFTPRKYPSMFLYSAERKLLDYEDNPESIFRFLNIINSTGK
jgi:peroxiredoxin